MPIIRFNWCIVTGTIGAFRAKVPEAIERLSVIAAAATSGGLDVSPFGCVLAQRLGLATASAQFWTRMAMVPLFIALVLVAHLAQVGVGVLQQRQQLVSFDPSLNRPQPSDGEQTVNIQLDLEVLEILLR